MRAFLSWRHKDIQTGLYRKETNREKYYLPSGMEAAVPDEEENNPCHPFTINQSDCISMCGNAGGKSEQTDGRVTIYGC